MWQHCVHYPYSTNQTQPNTKADPKSWLWVCFVSCQGLLFKNLHLFWVCSGSAMGLLGIRGPLYALKCDRLLACLLAYSKYTCKDIQSFFSSDLRIWFWSWGLLSHVLSVSAWGLLGVSSESAIADLKQTLGRHRKQAWGLVWVNYLIGWVWSIL